MAVTKTLLANKVLEKLGRIPAGGTVDSDDQTICDDAYDSVYEELRTLHLLDWGSSESIPTWAMLHVREIIANRVANDFGLPRNQNEEEAAKMAMAKHLAVDYSYQPTQATFY